MKVSDCIVKFLEYLGIGCVFGYQGGMITHLIDSLSKGEKIKYIQCYHEQSAAIAAEGYALESGGLGVAISTSGPGATNMITGIADAFYGSIPVLYITGQVNTYEYKYEKKMRQLGFQETDIVSLVKPITKYAVMIDRIEDLEIEFKKAVSIALSGRKGPVLIDLPMNIQRLETKEFDYNFVVERNYPKLNKSQVEEISLLLNKSKRPLVICGNGIFQGNSKNTIDSFFEQIKIPHVVSMLGKGSVNEDGELFCGMIGSYGNRCANIIFSQSDLVLVIGSRLDLRQTGNINSSIINKMKFVHVDIDENELYESKITNKINIHADAEEFILELSKKKIFVSEEWIKYCLRIKERYSQKKEVERFVSVPEPYETIYRIRDFVQEPATFVADVGQNQVWTTQSLYLTAQDKLYSSGGLAAMGFAIPCAVGASFANPDRKVVCITGDGGFHFALQSLMLISQYQLNICVFVLNNSSLGMITQFQTLYFNSNMIGTSKGGGYLVPEIKKIAEAYGLIFHDNFNDKLDVGSLYEIKLPSVTITSPKLEFDKDLDNMTPYLPEEEKTLLSYINMGGGVID